MENSSVNDQQTSPKPKIGFLAGFSTKQQLFLGLSIVAVIALVMTLVLWLPNSSYKPLNISLTGRELSEASGLFGQHHIDFKIDPVTGNLLINEQDLPTAHLVIAEANLGSSNLQNGFELLDKESGLGISSFIESANYQRGLEGELARTIAEISKIKNARVHLAIPKNAVFVRDEKTPSASVLVELNVGESLTPHEVTAITNIVAGSVANLTADKVTIVDHRGRLLNIEQTPDDFDEANKRLAYRKQFENMLLRRADDILRPVLGDNHYAVQLNAELDFSVSESTAETFIPEPILRSEQSNKEQLMPDDKAEGIPGSLSNQPPPPATAPERLSESSSQTANPQSQKEQFTRNYEVSRAVNHVKADTAIVKRLSLSIIVDAELDKSAEFADLGIAVKNALGLEDKRGDTFSLVSRPFASSSVDVTNNRWYLNPHILQLGKIVLIGIFSLLIVVLIIRFVSQIINSSKKQNIDENEPKAFTEININSSYSEKLNALKRLVKEDGARVAAAFKEWIN